MIPNLAVAALAVVWFAIVVRRSAGARLQGLVVAALPLALLFIAWPLTVAVWNMLQGMDAANEGRQNRLVIVVGLLTDISSSLGLGSVGALFTVTCAFGLQLWHSEAPDSDEETTAPRSVWPTMVLYCGVLLIPPVAIEAWLGHRVIDSFREAIDPSFLTRTSQASMMERSLSIASYSMLVIASGVLLSACLTILSIVNLEAFARGGRVKHAAWTWTIVVIVLVLAGWSVFRAQSGLRAFQTATLEFQGGTFYG